MNQNGNNNAAEVSMALPSISARDGVSIATGIGWAILGFVPVVGPGLSAAAGILNVIIPFLWPEDETPGTPQAQITWDKLMSTVEGLTDERILASKRSDATARLQGIQGLTRDYTQAINDLKTDPNNELKKDRVRDAFDDVEDYLKVSMPFFRAQGFEAQMLAMYAQAANMHLLLLRDVVQHGTSWGFQQYEVDRYYSNTNSQGNPGMLQLLTQYTEHCVSWYNTGLANRRATNNWDTFNNFRKDMTLMVLDIISLWPTYDPNFYAVPTKSQLTRTLYTPVLGRTSGKSLSNIEDSVVASPSLFTWLRSLHLYSHIINAQFGYSRFCGVRPNYQYTLNNNIITGEMKGLYGDRDRQDITIPSLQDNDDIRFIWTSRGNDPNYSQNTHQVIEWQFEFAKSATQTATTTDIRYPYWIESVLPYINENPNLYSHRFSHMGAGISINSSASTDYYSYGWTHVSADYNNLIDAQKITQIPAVKASSISGGARVVKGPGSTGGDLIELPFSTAGRITLNVTLADITKSYKVRVRYASGSNSKIADTLTYADFSYTDSDIITPSSSDYTYIYDLNPSDFGGLEGKFFIDKIEFIPM
ncbi:hypothetical protein FOA24_33820 [Bacillus thuringiensis]|uniref:insecticidal delta-endotoxin Cry8Ea1 family protein n=1 Tax=Bacillus thuringiensis TaxID=1428 RepID=UPI0033375C8D